MQDKLFSAAQLLLSCVPSNFSSLQLTSRAVHNYYHFKMGSGHFNSYNDHTYPHPPSTSILCQMLPQSPDPSLVTA